MSVRNSAKTSVRYKLLEGAETISEEEILALTILLAGTLTMELRRTEFDKKDHKNQGEEK
jgi:hypothetical protein